MTVVTDLFVMTNSSFFFFEKGCSHKSELECLEWEVKENFLGLNGWNNNQRDKITQNYFFEICESDDQMNLNFELSEINPLKTSHTEFLHCQGHISNILVRYFRNIDNELNKPEILHQIIPSLTIFEIDQETQGISQR